MTGRALLPDHALGLAGLSPASGGLGYRFWRSSADCAFLASYMHTSYHFPKLLPALAHLFPPNPELVPEDGMQPPRAPSVTAAFAARALARITAAAPLVHDRLVGAATVMNHTQHVLSAIANEAETRRVIGPSQALTTPTSRATWSFTTPAAAIPSSSPWSPPTQRLLSQTVPSQRASFVDSSFLSAM